VLHTRKFENVKRLIELHRLEGFSLWDCLTGCSNDPYINDDEHDSQIDLEALSSSLHSLDFQDSSGSYDPDDPANAPPCTDPEDVDETRDANWPMAD
jgi:hypothetical protein